VAQRVQAIGRHHHAVLAVVVTAPAKVFKLKSKGATGLGQHLHDLLACGDDFFANAVSGDGGDAVGFHGGQVEK
jgi:hypothetical protein